MKLIKFGFILSILIVSATVIKSCGTKETPKNADGSINGAKVYKTNCQSCHGADGKLGSGGAYDLSISELSHDESIAVVTKGRKAMMPYEKMLSSEEIEAVVKHIETLRK